MDKQMKLATHRFDSETLAALAALAHARGLTRSEVLRQAIREAARRELGIAGAGPQPDRLSISVDQAVPGENVPHD